MRTMSAHQLHANISYICLFDHGGQRRAITLATFYIFLLVLGYITFNSGHFKLSEKLGVPLAPQHRLAKRIHCSLLPI